MFRKFLPVILGLFGLGLGLGAGYLLRPTPVATAGNTTVDGATLSGTEDGHAGAATGAHSGTSATEYVKLNNQFVVPLIKSGKVGAMVILSLSVEVAAGNTQVVYSKEPKLRDSFLQVMFDHANAGGFDGPFTDSAHMIALRRALLETAHQSLGDMALDVLITDIVRQDT